MPDSSCFLHFSSADCKEKTRRVHLQHSGFPHVCLKNFFSLNLPKLFACFPNEFMNGSGLGPFIHNAA